MEKVIYGLWRRAGEGDRTPLNARLRAAADGLLDRPDVRGVRLNLQDGDVVRAEALRLRCGRSPQPDAVAQIWLDVSHDAFRRPIDEILADVAGVIAAWSVVSSTVIRNERNSPVAGERTPGWSQVCLIRRPDRLDRETWRHNWQDLHTQVAIETQSNFEYVQNLIVRPLIAGPEDYAAIVEECFPTAAMDDPRAFFDAVDDEARFRANTAAMALSCARFIDGGCVDLLPTSQYDLRRLRADPQRPGVGTMYTPR